MLASNPVFGNVTMVGTVLTVAVTATPLELIVTRVTPAASVLMASNVASVFVPSMVDRPGVNVSVAEPSVMQPLMAAGVDTAALDKSGLGMISGCTGSLLLVVCPPRRTVDWVKESSLEMLVL